MLNITRKAGERIIIGDGEIMLEVLEISGSTVRVGIKAPRSVSVYREEIWEAVRAENAEAARSTSTSLPSAEAPAGAPSRRPSVQRAQRAADEKPMSRTKVRARSTRGDQDDAGQ